MKQFNEYYYNLIKIQNFYTKWKNYGVQYFLMSYVFGILGVTAYVTENFETCSTLNLLFVLCLCILGYITEKLEKNVKI